MSKNKRMFQNYPHLIPLYEEFYGKRNRAYFEMLEKRTEALAAPNGCRFVDNETPCERVQQGHPTIVAYFYHEEVRGTENSGNGINDPLLIKTRKLPGRMCIHPTGLVFFCDVPGKASRRQLPAPDGPLFPSPCRNPCGFGRK